MQRSALSAWLLSVGLATVFGYFGFDKFTEPLLWIGWMPPFMDGLFGMSLDLWLNVVGVFEVVAAVLVLIPVGNVRRVGATLMAVQLLAILPIAGLNDVGLRDFGLMMSALALAVML